MQSEQLYTFRLCRGSKMLRVEPTLSLPLPVACGLATGDLYRRKPPHHGLHRFQPVSSGAIVDKLEGLFVWNAREKTPSLSRPPLRGRHPNRLGQRVNFVPMAAPLKYTHTLAFHTAYMCCSPCYMIGFGMPFGPPPCMVCHGHLRQGLKHELGWTHGYGWIATRAGGYAYASLPCEAQHGHDDLLVDRSNGCA